MISNEPSWARRYALSVERTELYHPGVKDWSYSHHPSITWFGGEFYAIWSNGWKHEDDVGQRVVLSRSTDGMAWSQPRPVVDTIAGRHNPEVLTASGFHVYGTTLTVFAGCYEYAPDNVADGHYQKMAVGHERVRLLAASTEDGQVWSNPTDLNVPVIPNHGPQRLRSGRMLISGNFAFPYTDDPSCRTGWQTGTLPGSRWEGWYDDPEGHKIASRVRDDGIEICEGSFYQRDDGTIVMLLRSDKKRLFVSFSNDDGETWSPAGPTLFTDCGTKFHCGRLPSGAYYIVSCPDADQPRCPLVVSLSDDGEVFDRQYVIESNATAQRIAGKHKGGVYGYPHTLIRDGRMYVICSIHKEDVVVFRFSIEQLV